MLPEGDANRALALEFLSFPVITISAMTKWYLTKDQDLLRGKFLKGNKTCKRIPDWVPNVSCEASMEKGKTRPREIFSANYHAQLKGLLLYTLRVSGALVIMLFLK